MIIIGLTGGIASGKSLVARVFKDLGAHLIDADKIAHDLLEPGEPAWQEVIDHFGVSLLRPDNEIDRGKLGDIVFSNENERKWLNNCLHPKVFEVFSSLVRHLGDRDPESVVVLDAALLIETGYHKRMDHLVVVFTTVEQQVERLILRNQYDYDHALARIKSQMPLSEKRKLADYVIDNTGSRDETQRQAREVFAACRRSKDKKDKPE